MTPFQVLKGEVPSEISSNIEKEKVKYGKIKTEHESRVL